MGSSGTWGAGQTIDLVAMLTEAAAASGFDIRELAGAVTAEELARAELEAKEAAKETAKRQRTADLELRGVDAKHARLIVEGGLRETAALKAARAWAEGSERVLVFSGSKGAGKSLAAGWLVAKLGGRVIPAALLCDEGWWLREGRRSEITRCTRDDLAKTPLLVIDDLGQEAAARREHTAEVVATLVQLRTAAGRRTVITTNLLSRRASPSGHDTLASYLAGRAELVFERLLEHGKWCDVTGNLRHEEARRRRPGGTDV